MTKFENASHNANHSSTGAFGFRLLIRALLFPVEIYRAPETWARRAYPSLIYFHEVDKGGHFAAWEQPQPFTEGIRAAFRSFR
jgi:pimeloyl-ACP methyl ester carboxylesterase